MSEVLNCPFCGCPPEISRNSKTKEPIDCGCINIHCPAESMDTVSVEAWNHRAHPEPAQAQVSDEDSLKNLECP